MKHRILLLIFVFALVSCTQSEHVNVDWRDSVRIDPSIPPEGMHLMHILLENQSFPLKGTGCESSRDDKHTLQHLLASTLGDGIGNNANKQHQVIVSADCKAEQFELQSGSVIDGWRCNLNVTEKTNKKGEYIAGSSVAFGVRKDTWTFITDSITPNPLVCMP